MTSERDAFGTKNKTNKIQMGSKILGKGQKSKSSMLCEPKLGPNVENHHCTHTVPIIFIPFLFYMLHVALLYNFLKEM